MSPGDIILINFPFTVPSVSKVRPAVIITITDDRFHDLVVCAISSIIPDSLTKREIPIRTTDNEFSQTGLRVDSVVKVDRIATLRRSDVITTIGHCSSKIWQTVIEAFRTLVA